MNMDCPSCGTPCVTRSGGENVTIVECPDCEPEPLWLAAARAAPEFPLAVAKAVYLLVAAALRHSVGLVTGRIAALRG